MAHALAERLTTGGARIILARRQRAPTPSHQFQILHTVLLLDADSRVGTACLQSLGPAGHRVHVAVRRLGAPAERSRWCHRVHVQPAAEPVEAGVDWLVELDARFSFALVIPTTEASLR